MVETMTFKDKKTEVQRVKTGINGLDNLMEGGFPKGSNVVVSGLPGSGKTIFAMAYIAEGCKNNQKCLYITVEQPPSEIKKQALQFGWDFSIWEESGLLQFIHVDFKKPLEMKMFNEILRIIENDHYDRIVFDSINPISHAPIPIYSVDGTLSMQNRDVLKEMVRTNIITLFDATRKNEVTSVCISQKDEKDPSNTIVEYIGDTLMVFDAGAIGKTPSRTLQIKKMRLTNVDRSPQNFEITKDGFVLI